MSLARQHIQALTTSTAMRSIIAALLFVATSAYAVPVTLSCRDEANAVAITLRINYANGLLEQLNSNGDAYNRRSVTATISQNAIVWSIDQPSSYLTGDGVTHQTTEHWSGNIDRLSATGWVRSYDDDHYPNIGSNITCRQATQKF